MNIKLLALVFSILLFTGMACKDNTPGTGCDDCVPDDTIEGIYNPTPATLDIPDWLPDPQIPADNAITEEGIELGRMLFYDPILIL